MIERLLSTLRLLTRRASAEGADLREVAADYSDALRLVIDCPQIRLDPEQRDALERVEDALERGDDDARVAELARAALALLRD